MNWLIFQYTLPRDHKSRVTLWRRIKKLGAISPIQGTHILPDTPDCLEGFQWLLQTVKEDGGDTLLVHSDRLQGFSDEDLKQLFHQEMRGDYLKLQDELKNPPADLDFRRLLKRFQDLQSRDHFNSPEGQKTARLLQKLREQHNPRVQLPLKKKADFQGRTWRTRPGIFVDRIASAWFIRTFLDPHAVIHYSDESREGEITFDLLDADFTHVADLCTFEVLVHSFEETSPEMLKLAEIIHALDVEEAGVTPPEAEGLKAIFNGYIAQGLPDHDRAEQGGQVLSALLAHFKAQMAGLEVLQ
ncbi:chromate resistance protein ChrB domain-containing protein [Deinococcus cellulosilyticus]|uniref:ChrB protein n=1 Tax=Deinococcus cellulosilyticus (strain DSM 18568 / NBRC 106333 / KACC 11606 / 5516J-15) TaxID=1223518 RepID=A0A511N170_DEIC1|nr:chromate resistance protein ChrB domain-containing protein [Deinococcus cellulosilyticus]GEM46217.1 chrB protein [Deinococcus cellulosilyticus NBRC 106333 = KACC 11606]